MSPVEIRYDTDERQFLLNTEQSLLELLLKKKIPVNHSCEGMASCGTCRILVTSDVSQLPPRNDLELEMSRDRGFEEHERLSCQLCPKHSLSFRLPSDPE